MGEHSKIQWTHHTFNPWIGCTKIAPECTNCYASVQTFARVQRGKGRELWGPKGERHVTSDANWRQPLKWNREAKEAGERRRVFCASLADVFDDRGDLYDPRARLYGLIRETPHLDWLLLTKRPENADRLWVRAQTDWWNGADSLGPTWAPNVWLGTSAGSMKTATALLPHLFKVPAAVRFISMEPILEHVDVFDVDGPVAVAMTELDPNEAAYPAECTDWVIVGGESGPGARPCNVEWIRSVVRQCRDAGVPCFVKQGGFLNRCAHDAKGGCLGCMPEDIRIREFPNV